MALPEHHAAIRLLRWFCPDHLSEEIEGDLTQRYENDVKKAGERRAVQKLWWNALRYLRPGIVLRHKTTYNLIQTVMLRSYAQLAFRNLKKNKVFSAINIFGLATGLASCLLIFQFVSFELSYDTFNPRLDRIYRVTNDRFQHGKLVQHGTISYPTIGPTMTKDFPEIEAYTRLMPFGKQTIKVEDKLFKEGDFIFADERFLDILAFPLLAGNTETALRDPYTMVLTEAAAVRYFGATDGDYSKLLGKAMRWGNDPRLFAVTGVCKNPPDNSHITFDALASYATVIASNSDADNSWNWSDMRHYLLLRPDADPQALEAKFSEFSERYFHGDKVSGSIEKFYLQPLREAHLYSDYEYDIARTASGQAVWAMLLVAIFILMIAWINYINLTTARAIDRAKEVGLRKVMGAVKAELVKQFIFESLLITLIALVAALVLVQLAQGGFNRMIGGNLSLWTVLTSTDTNTLLLLAGMLAAGILLAGFYPAFILSSYQPAVVLKGKFQRSSGGQWMRRGLVVFQFVASTALITGTMIVSQQIGFMNRADLGINISNTVVVDGPENTEWDSTFVGRIENYKHALTQLNGVVSAATSNRRAGDRLGRTFGVRLSEQPAETKFTLSVQDIDHDWLDTYAVKVLAGRKFLPTDHHADFQQIKNVILNENAVRLLGVENPADIIGREVIWGRNGTRKWTVIGVVSDFHQESLKKPMEPMIFRPVYGTYSPTSIKIQGRAVSEVLPEIENTFKTFFPDNAFVYASLEDQYGSQYNDDRRFGQVMNVFTVLAIIISILGLIGLSAYTATQRTKEIGVRKVLGASLTGIVSLLSIDFIKLVVVAVILSFPISYYAMSSWLDGYAYRITLGWILFVLPPAFILAIAILTVGTQVLKAAMANPSETLRYE